MSSPDDPISIETVRRDKPLEPIVLDEYGNALEGLSPSTRETDFITRDSKDPTIGRHRFCEGHIQRLLSSGPFYTLICRKCFLRIHISDSVLTYHDLRIYAEELKAKRERIERILLNAQNTHNMNMPFG